MTRLLIIDGNGYLHRAFHAYDKLTTSDGFPNGAIQGVKDLTINLFRQLKPSHCIAVFDHEGGSFRNRLYPEYKANRPPSDPNLKLQRDPIKEMFEAAGIPVVSKEGVEADDVIGSLSQSASKHGVDTLIASSDKDMAQLINAYTRQVIIQRGEVLFTDEDKVIKKFGVRASQIRDYLALIGDTSDNVPGVVGCGSKTASKWLGAFETIDGIIENKHRLTGKVGESFRNNLDQLSLSRELVTIKTDITVGLNLSDMALKVIEGRRSQIEDWYRKYEINGDPQDWFYW